MQRSEDDVFYLSDSSLYLLSQGLLLSLESAHAASGVSHLIWGVSVSAAQREIAGA